MQANMEKIQPPRFGARKHRGLARERDPLAIPTAYKKHYQKRSKRLVIKPISKRLRKLLDL